MKLLTNLGECRIWLAGVGYIETLGQALMVKRKQEEDTGDEKLGSDPFLVEIGRRIKKLRTDAGMTQTELGDAAGRVSPAYIYLVERGRQNMTLSVFRRIAESLKVPIEDLLSEADLQAAPTDRSLRKLLYSVEKLKEVVAARSEQEAMIVLEMEKIREAHDSILDYLRGRDDGLEGAEKAKRGR